MCMHGFACAARWISLLITNMPSTQALAKYAFGLGLLQMVFSTAAFTVFSLPVGAGIGTIILERVITMSAA